MGSKTGKAQNIPAHLLYFHKPNEISELQ